jgi:hypothetical protein
MLANARQSLEGRPTSWAPPGCNSARAISEHQVETDERSQLAQGRVVRRIGATTGAGFAQQRDRMVLAIDSQELTLRREDRGLVAHPGPSIGPVADDQVGVRLTGQGLQLRGVRHLWIKVERPLRPYDKLGPVGCCLPCLPG